MVIRKEVPGFIVIKIPTCGKSGISFPSNTNRVRFIDRAVSIE